MERESDGPASAATFESPASRDAEAQQEEIIGEEERSMDALELVGHPIPAVDEPLPNDALALAARGRNLAAESVELRAVAEQAQSAAKSARRVATEARGQAIAIRRLCETDRHSYATRTRF